MKRLFASIIAAVAFTAFTVLASAADIEGKKITLPSTERAVHVTQFKAPGDAPRPSVLLLHGAGGFDRRLADYNRYESSLANQGMDAYLVYYYSDNGDKVRSNGVDGFDQRYSACATPIDELAGHVENH